MFDSEILANIERIFRAKAKHPRFFCHQQEPQPTHQPFFD